MFLAPEWIFRADLEKLSKLDRRAGATTWLIPVGIVAAVILGLGILFPICQWRRCKRCFHPEVTTCPDHVSPGMVLSPPICSTEDETQSQLELQPGTTPPMEDGGPRGVPKALFQCCPVERGSDGC